MQNALITGVSGYIGSTVHKALESDPRVKKIVGIDVNPPSFSHSKLVFCKRDVRQPIVDLLEAHDIDTVIHAAYILPPMHNNILMEDININGTKAVLESCSKTRIQHLLYTSSTTAYGFHADNPIPMLEKQALRGNDNFTYSKNKKEIETLFELFIAQNPAIKVTILRPCFVIGAGIDNPISRYLLRSVVILPSQNSPIQFVHEDDLCRAMMLCLENGIKGVFNISGEGSITFPDMIKRLKKPLVKLPYNILIVLNQVAWKARLKFLTEIPSSGLAMIRFPWIASSKKFIEQTGFKFNFTTQEAFEDFARHKESQ